MIGPSREEFTSTMDRLDRQVATGFAGVNERLDDLNGRTRKGEVADAEMNAKIRNLEKEVFGRRVDDGDRIASREVFRPQDTSSLSFFTARERTMMGIGVGIIFALMKLVEFLGGHVVEAGAAMLKHWKP